MTDDTIPYLHNGQRITNEAGEPLDWFVNAWNALLDRTGGQGTNLVGVNLAGVNQAQADATDAKDKADGLIAGTQAVTDTYYSGRGYYSAEQDAQSVDVQTDFTITPAASYVQGIGTGTVSTNSVSIAISGGTAPYSIIYSNAGGTAMTASGPATLSADGSISVSWSGDASGSFIQGQQKVSVTDSAGTPLMAETVIAASIVDTSYISGGL